MSDACDRLLMKHGLYYRPNNSGYTGIKDHAGRYPVSDARPEDGVLAIPEDDAPAYLPTCYSLASHASAKVKEMAAAIQAQSAALKAAREALSKARGTLVMLTVCANAGTVEAARPARDAVRAALAQIDALSKGIGE